MSIPLTEQEIEIRIAQLRQNVEEVRRQLLRERQHGKPDKHQLTELIETKQDKIEKIQARIKKAKAKAKKRKREIADWKQWLHTLPGTDRTDEQEKLTLEINWRGKAINALQDTISYLGGKKWVIKGELEALQQQLLALDEGIYDRPIEEDPRLIYAISVCDEEIAALEVSKVALKH